MKNSGKKQAEPGLSRLPGKQPEEKFISSDSDEIEACEQSSGNESGGYENLKEPTRYGDWEIAGRCVDF